MRDALTGRELPFVVVFEVLTAAGMQQDYLDIAKHLRPMLDDIPGFQSIERSVSLARENALLSLSYWADAAALVQWRSTGEHHAAQQAGRDRIFADYRLRVGQVRGVTSAPVSAIPPGGSTYNRPPFHPRQFMSIARLEGVTDRSVAEGLVTSLAQSIEGLNGYVSLADPTRYYFTIPSRTDSDPAKEVNAFFDELDRSGSSDARVTVEMVEVERDYGLRARGQAPQFFPTGGTMTEVPTGHDAA